MNPAEVVKQRMQMVYSPYGSSLECARCIYKVEGIAAFYRSYTTSLIMVNFSILHSSNMFLNNLISECPFPSRAFHVVRILATYF